MKRSHFISFAAFLALFFIAPQLNAQEKQARAGSYLKAKVDGIEWQAEKMVFDKYPSEIVQIWGDKGTTSLKLQLNKPAQGKIDQLIKTDLNSWTDAQFNIYGVKNGEIQVTKMDDHWIEGGFHATLKDDRSAKEVAITSGSFRIPNPKNFKE